ncbi:MAG: Eco47II family restriction endonuclease [Bacteroides sp.]|nr:Eco47II family restriction endonuclease [Bacteroides sp.]
MKDYQLGFISNEDIFKHVKETVSQYRTFIDLKGFNENIIDPVKLTFDAKVYGKTFEEIIDSECIRQIDKTNSNRIGYFHQNLFKYAGNGWVVPAAGFDVVNDERHIYAELKNKHNTMNSASSQKTYMKMQGQLLQDDQAVCMLVEVIAKKSQNIKWATTVDGNPFSHERIRRVSIDKFYGIVFGDNEAFFKLCKALPDILDDVIADLQCGSIQSTVYDELRELSPDTFKSLYLLAFKTYDGFQSL